MLEIKVTGAYKTAKGDIVDYEQETVVMPDVPIRIDGERPESLLMSHIQNRYIQTAIGNAVKKDGSKKYEKRFDMHYKCWIDSVKETKDAPSCIGKNIKELDWNELQDLAVIEHLYEIPVVRQTSIREAREIAYLLYCEKRGNLIDTGKEDYKFSELPPMIVSGAKQQKIKKVKEVEAQEIVEESIESTFTLAELKQVADERNIAYSPNIGYSTLYERVFG